MKTKIEIKCIGIWDKVPKGFKYLSSWDCEKLLCTNFDVFEDLEKSRYYKIINPINVRWLWLHGLNDDSYINGDGRWLDNYDGVRGVLVWQRVK